jgi:hypothetical protein
MQVELKLVRMLFQLVVPLLPLHLALLSHGHKRSKKGLPLLSLVVLLQLSKQVPLLRFAMPVVNPWSMSLLLMDKLLSGKPGLSALDLQPL